MNPVVLDGQTLSNKICRELRDKCDMLKLDGIQPRLMIITSGQDEASQIYCKHKIKRCQEIGIQAEVKHFDFLTTHNLINAQITSNIPIIFQMPMTGNVELEHLPLIVKNPFVDVDGCIHPINTFKIFHGQTPPNYPCTAKGIMRLLSEYNIELEGKSVCVIGRSNIVGRPIVHMMEQANATVTLCHSKTPDQVMYKAIQNADIIVSAVGQPNTIKFDRANIVSCWNINWNEKIVIDAGINRDENGKLCGDIEPVIYNHCKMYTPVPGSVGPMTVAMLMENVLEYYENFC